MIHLRGFLPPHAQMVWCSVVAATHQASPARRESPRMDKIAFSSQDLPPHLDDPARLVQWRDFLSGIFGALEVSCLPDRPFSQQLNGWSFDAVGLVRFEGSADRIASLSSAVAATMRPD